MNHVLEHDRQKYIDLAAGVPQYRDFSPGEHFAPTFAELAGQKGTVLDAGCCTGKGGIALREMGFDVTLCDYTSDFLDAGAAELPFHKLALWDAGHIGHSFDYVFCCDVLEHLPKEFTLLAVRELLAIAKHGAFFTIGLTPDNFGAWVGKPLHETIESFVWWRDRLRVIGNVIDARDLVATGLYFVRAK